MTDGLTLTHTTFVFDNRPPVQELYLLAGPNGVIQFKAGRHREALGACEACKTYPSISHFDLDGNCWFAWDLGYHSPTPRYDGHEPIADQCKDANFDGPCYYDGTGLGASELLDAWLGVGQDEAFLRYEMTQRYHDWLVEGDEAFASPVTALSAALKDHVDRDEAGPA